MLQRKNTSHASAPFLIATSHQPESVNKTSNFTFFCCRMRQRILKKKTSHATAPLHIATNQQAVTNKQARQRKPTRLLLLPHAVQPLVPHAPHPVQRELGEALLDQNRVHLDVVHLHAGQPGGRNGWVGNSGCMGRVWREGGGCPPVGGAPPRSTQENEGV